MAVLSCFTPKHDQSNTEGFGETNNQSNIPAINNLSNEQLKNYQPVLKTYNSANGFPVKDVNTGQNTLFKDSKGIIWIATGSDKTALVRLDEDALWSNPNPPTIVIKNIKINGENICWYNLQTKQDSTINAQQEIMSYGKLLEKQERDSLLKKFSALQFDGITKFYPLPTNLTLPYKHNNISIDFNAIETGKHHLVRYQYMLEGYDEDWNPVTDKDNATFGNIYEGTYTFKLKAMSPEGVWSEPVTYTFKVLPPWYRTWWAYTIYTLFAVGGIIFIVWWNGRRLRARADELKVKVNEATLEIKEQKNLIEEKHKEITDSINYAERIQRSFLATKEVLDVNLNDYFIFFQPKDVVSGDFYWASSVIQGKFFLCVADSTGHGVPGAIMSILNISTLELAIKEKLTAPSEIFNYARKEIITRLRKDGSADGGKDGMDASLIVLNNEKTKLTFSAANNPIWIIRKNEKGLAELIEAKPDKMPIGKHDKDQIPFTQHEIDLQKGDLIYLLTDGMPDQFGGPKGKKYKYTQLKEFLISISSLSMNDQHQQLKSEFERWKGELEQVDDVTLIGIRV